MANKCPTCHVDNPETVKFCGECGTPIHPDEKAFISFTKTLRTPSQELISGNILADKYRIIEELGRGGMGVVYKAEDLKLKRFAALKFLPLEMMMEPEARERFNLEAQAAAALSHPNICTIYEVSEAEDKPFIAMEYIEGKSLREKLKIGPFKDDEALDIAIQVAEGLEEAHKKGIIHRDIKSANIMVTEKNQAKIMDFGLAKLRGGSSLTQAGATLGTVAYMSPEQARGENVDQRTDLWSLGVVLYEILTGELPFRGEREASVLYSVVHEGPKPLRDRKPPLPLEMEQIIYRALKKNPESRYQTAEEMSKDLKEFREILKAAEAGVFNLRPFWRHIRQPRIAIPAVLIIVAMLFLGIRFFKNQAKARWARNELLPQIAQLAQNVPAPFFDTLGCAKIYQVAVEAEKFIPNNSKLAEMFKNYSVRLSIITDPAAAKVFIKGYHAPEKEWEYLGLSPIENLRVPIEFLRLKMEKEGYETVLAASTSWDWDTNLKVKPGKVLRKLDKDGDIPSGMVRITGIEDRVAGKIDDFFMDRFEITNKQYKEFIKDGGYQKKEFWKTKFVKDGKNLSWEQAMAELVDSTGRPGPATWQGGDYPDGQDNFPVSGVSWYEAAAYAEYVHKSLPTANHWEIASGRWTLLNNIKGFYGFLIPQSNFKGKGLDRVGSNLAITSYGLYDIGGNVREWCFNETPQGRLIRGGAWNDVPYMFGNQSQLSPFDRSAKNGFRCAIYIHPERIPQSAFAKLEISGFPDFYKQKPAPDSVFKVYREQFSYDERDLNAQVEWRNETSSEWIQEKISFDAGYEDERVFAYLFLPKNSSPPFQTVIYFPTSGAVSVRSSQDMDKYWEFMPFIVKNGRAFLFPVYKGTFERGNDALADIIFGENSRQYVGILVKAVKDLRRSVDYLETRPDIDCKKLAYLGWSWGGQYGAIIPAVEDRLKVSVLNAGGMDGIARPEANEINYVSRVKIPTLMLNGRYDMTCPYGLSVKPMFDLLGTPPEEKELKLYDSDHVIPTNEFIKETLAWLDKYLGPVK